MKKLTKEQYKKMKKKREEDRIGFLQRYEEIQEKFRKQFEYKNEQVFKMKDPELATLFKQNIHLQQMYNNLYDQDLFIQNAISQLRPLFNIRKTLQDQISNVQDQLKFMSQKNSIIENENQRIQKQIDKNRENYKREIYRKDQMQNKSLSEISQQISIAQYKIEILKQKYMEEQDEQKFANKIRKKNELVQSIQRKEAELGQMKLILAKITSIKQRIQSQREHQGQILSDLKLRNMEQLKYIEDHK